MTSSSHPRRSRLASSAALLLAASVLPTNFQILSSLPCGLVVDAANGSSPVTADNFFLQNPTYNQAASGPIEDATCDVEQLEQANDSQLHVILAELMTTSFFRSFAVDLDEGCPLAGWTTKKKKKSKKPDEKREQADNDSGNQSSSTPASFLEMQLETIMEESEEEGCAGGLPDLDPDAEPACSVDLGGGGDNLGFLSAGGGFGGGAISSLSSNTALSTPSTQSDVTSSITETQEEEDDGFECTGGEDELDEDAPPLCSLATDDSQNTNPFTSAALHRVSEQLQDSSTWESESQQNTFEWNKPSDPVVENFDVSCDEASSGNLPETFWLDMCSQIQTGDGMSIVNLQLNPERNTGYNGTHIWHAIYEENCLALDGSASEPMCYEERVLYRLLSGLHTSTTLSIAKNYYPPSKRKGREHWEPNAQYFIDKFAERPEHLRNLHFSYVVLLRALKKASPFLYNFEIKTGDILDDEMAAILLKRLLDSTILRSCHDVFTAFDENLMFKEQSTAMSLQESFKGVFHNVSSILDCVQCQQCKLHGKMAMLGYGTALKILFLPENRIDERSLSRNEIVAFLNTIAKMSESVREVRELTHLYWSTHTRLEKSVDGLPTTVGSGSGATIRSSAGIDGVDVLDIAVGAVSSLANQGLIDESSEAKLIQQAFQRHPELMVLSKHYGNDLRKFLNFLPNIDNQIVVSTSGLDKSDPDAIVVGSGLAGLAAALNILDRGGRVVVIEKEHRMGGNSNKASSGINACCPQNSTYGDDLDTFKKDTIRSAGNSARSHLIETLVENSEAAVQWLKDRVGVDLSILAQLGGHGHKRTHRPSSGMVGAEVIYNIQRAVKQYETSGMVKIYIDTRVTQLLTHDDGAVVGVDVVTMTKDGANKTMSLTAPNIILATGGFASDRSSGSYLEQYRPELMKMPATAGEFSTGDGITLGTSVGAGLVDMEKVQVHPTGWVDPKDPTNPGKILAGELMRGVGGILINSSGKRFCNELGTRAYVTDKMFGHDSGYEQSKKWNVSSEVPTFSLVLSSSAAAGAKKHVDHYLNKGLLFKLEGITDLAKWMDLPIPVVKATLQEYQQDAKIGSDEWGKTSFSSIPQDNLSKDRKSVV